MESYNLIEQIGTPFTGSKLDAVKEFLAGHDLTYDTSIEYTMNLLDENYQLIGTGSLHSNVIKCIAVAEQYQDSGLLAKLLTQLVTRAVISGSDHLFLFTKPSSKHIFSDLGFYTITETKDVLFMENYRNGIQRYVEKLVRETAPFLHEIKRSGKGDGAIIANCNPFTKGHRYLIETAAAQCDLLHLFLLSEDKSTFSTKTRYELVKKGISDLQNVILHETSDYMISQATFPTYFLKDQTRAGEINCDLDIQIFLEYAAKGLNITKRFAGTEPFCQVTNYYNEQMKKKLDVQGVEFIEIPRKELQGNPISAANVRSLMVKGDWEGLKELVPETTYHFLASYEGRMIAEVLKKKNLARQNSCA